MEGQGWGFEEEEEGGEEGEGRGGSPNDELQTSFPFLPLLLMKRPILAVGWNLSDLSPCFSPSGACRMSLSSSLPFVSGFLLWCSCCAGSWRRLRLCLGRRRRRRWCSYSGRCTRRLEVKAGISAG